MQKRIALRQPVKAFDAVDLFRTSAPARYAKAEPAKSTGGVGPERAEAHDADRNSARRPLDFRRPALRALAGPQVRFLAVMHQHVKHDIFRHAAGEVADRDADQRHFRQRGIGHQRVDAGAEVENDAQVRKCRKLARNRLPNRRVVDFRAVGRRVGQQQDTAIPAHLVEPALPSLRRPVVGPAVHQQGKRAFVHRIFAFMVAEFRATLSTPDVRAKYFRSVSAPGILKRLPLNRNRFPHALRHPLLSR